MKTNDNFQETSYKIHREVYDDFAVGGDKEALAKTWLQKDSVGAWRFERMYRLLDPILESEPDAKWLTVGDGRYGGDAKYIQDKGIDVLATDITDKLLKEAKDKGYLKKYRQENAESLSFNDSEFDFVLCKESYHHFPRPMIALYEMLRVAAKGVVLIEPTDLYINNGIRKVLFRKLMDLINGLLGKKIKRHAFEEAGNYIYNISRREIEKVALGLSYRLVAFHGVNDYYEKGVEFEKISDKGRLYRKVKFRISLLNMLTRTKFNDYSLTVAIIFKKEPSAILIKNLNKAGYDIVSLPINPYIYRGAEVSYKEGH